MNPILEIVSIRLKNLHCDPATGETKQEFSSINKAKAHSRILGGAGKVRAFSDRKKVQEFVKEFKQELEKETAKNQEQANV